MKQASLKFIFIFLMFSLVGSLKAQQSRFSAELQKFKKLDSISMPPQNAILFIGSSSFTKWTDVQNYFPGYPIINRGFGGSILPEVT